MTPKSRENASSKRVAPVPPSASLVTHETIVQPPPLWRVSSLFPAPDPADYQPGLPGPTLPVRRATRREIAFRHAGWHAKRQAVAEALRALGTPLPRQERFHQCGAACSMLVNVASGERKLVGSYCRDRFCLPCGTARGLYISENLLKLMGQAECRHVVLTQKSYGRSLTSCIDSLVASFARLRKEPFWKWRVKGGAAMLELKRGKRSGEWHVHYHVICHGRYLDQKELADVWCKVTGGSRVVWVSSIPDNRKLASYATKYCAKPLDPSIFENRLDLAECISALHGRRLCNTFGDWRGTELEEKPDDGAGWIEVGPLDAILRLAEQRDPDAFGATLLLRREGWGEGPSAGDSS